ncbi:MAG: HdaA/DnaA family protein [Casimicrobium sp.]
MKALLSEVIAQRKRAVALSATDELFASPFIDADALLIDDADRLNDEAQAFAFNAFNHIVLRGGLAVATGTTPPAQWQIREDLRTRLASGLTFELRAAPHDELPELLFDYANKRGVKLSEEVLTYIVNHTDRDVAKLCQTISGIDRLSLASKRPITIPLVRTFLSQQTSSLRKI